MVELSDETMTDELMTGAIRPGGMVLIGEMHGTHEFPRLVGQLADLAVDRQLPVLVGLEVPSSEQGAIDSFLAGPGGPPEVEALTASGFWHRPPQHDDGRSGQALVDLLAAVRLTAARGPIQVCAFDQPWAPDGTIATPEQAAAWTMPRDQYMADTLTRTVEQSAAAGQEAFTVVLAGNMHTRIVRYPGFDEAHLAELLDRAVPPSDHVGRPLVRRPLPGDDVAPGGRGAPGRGPPHPARIGRALRPPRPGSPARPPRLDQRRPPHAVAPPPLTASGQRPVDM